MNIENMYKIVYRPMKQLKTLTIDEELQYELANYMCEKIDNLIEYVDENFSSTYGFKGSKTLINIKDVEDLKNLIKDMRNRAVKTIDKFKN